MPDWNTFGKILIGIGLGIVVLGVLLVVVDRIPGLGNTIGWLGKLPGDVGDGVVASERIPRDLGLAQPRKARQRGHGRGLHAIERHEDSLVAAEVQSLLR